MDEDPPQARQPAKRLRSARYVVFVDNQAKRSFDTFEAADHEARKILERFPKLAVRVADQEQDSLKIAKPIRVANAAAES